MKQRGRDFFAGADEIVLVGYSSKPDSFSRMVYRELTNAGIKVHPVNPKKGSAYDVKVYADVSEISPRPQIAYVLLNPSRAGEAVSGLAGKGIKKVLFQSRKSLTPDVVDICSKAGMEYRAFCPMMVFGKGLHRFHAFLAGV